jgi:hypothetical protein
MKPLQKKMWWLFLYNGLGELYAKETIKTIYEGIAVIEIIDIGKMYSFELLDSSNFASIEKLEVK